MTICCGDNRRRYKNQRAENEKAAGPGSNPFKLIKNITTIDAWLITKNHITNITTEYLTPI